MNLRSLGLQWIFICLIFPKSTPRKSATVTEEILDKLTNYTYYNKQAIPTYNADYPTTVNISMYIEGISTFRAVTMDFQVDVYFQQKWFDPRLQHNSSVRILIKDIGLLQRMWYPDLYFANARQADFHEVTQPNFLIWIYPNGTVFYDTRISLVVMCMMDLAKWPLDRQHCNIRILSYAYDEEQLQIRWIDMEPIQKNEFIRMPDMHLMKIEPGACNGTYSTGVWSCVTAEFYVRREIMHHLVQSYLPTALIVVISWFSFWLDVDAVPARVSLSITTLLTLSTQANAARMALPEVSYMKAIDVWMGTCMAFVFGVMIEFTVANYAQRQEENPSPKPSRRSSTKEQPAFTEKYDVRVLAKGEKMRNNEDSDGERQDGFRGAIKRIRSYKSIRKLGRAMDSDKFVLKPVIEAHNENSTLLANNSDLDGETTDEEKKTFTTLQRVLALRKQEEAKQKPSVSFAANPATSVIFDNASEASQSLPPSPQSPRCFAAVGIRREGPSPTASPLTERSPRSDLTKLKSTLAKSSVAGIRYEDKSEFNDKQQRSVSSPGCSLAVSDVPLIDASPKLQHPLSGWQKVRKVTLPVPTTNNHPEEEREPSPTPSKAGGGGWGRLLSMSATSHGTTTGSDLKRRVDRGADKWISAVKQLQTNRKLLGREAAKRIDQRSRWFFPLAFTLFNIFYWVFYMYLF